MFVSGGWWSEPQQAAGAGAPQWVKAGPLLIATAAAGAVLAGQPLAPASRAPADRPGAPSPLSATSDHAPPTVVAPTGRPVDRVAQSPKATTPMLLGIHVPPPSLPPPSVPFPQT